MSDDCHAAYEHASNCITPCTNMVHMVEMLKIAYGRSRKVWRVSWIRKDEEAGPNIIKISVRIDMRFVAGSKCWKVIGQHHLSLR